ncbi:hypothetical protein HOE31_04435 [bacterium]|jgi:hypothetical protein|nr:hypothetical protein [bacterium]MBT4122167.1 hypothetical protein [bacterium]MBT4335660.1 hypothetical protein [bacterium]MBT4495632.1 hypothetical protein [bacterium]MBT4763582.1 hypothetical protein [bacterium]
MMIKKIVIFIITTLVLIAGTLHYLPILTNWEIYLSTERYRFLCGSIIFGITASIILIMFQNIHETRLGTIWFIGTSGIIGIINIIYGIMIFGFWGIVPGVALLTTYYLIYFITKITGILYHNYTNTNYFIDNKVLP